jgi:hypothetical protein
MIAERGRPHGTGLGIFRYVVERTIAWSHGFRRPRIRWERRDDIHEALLGLVRQSIRGRLPLVPVRRRRATGCATARQAVS